MGVSKGLGKWASEFASGARKYGDKALANKTAKWGIIGGGAGLYVASRASDNKYIRGAGDIGALGALGLGGYWGVKAGGLLKSEGAAAASAATSAGRSVINQGTSYVPPLMLTGPAAEKNGFVSRMRNLGDRLNNIISGRGANAHGSLGMPKGGVKGSFLDRTSNQAWSTDLGKASDKEILNGYNRRRMADPHNYDGKY